MTTTASIVMDNSNGKTVGQRPTAADNYLHYADSAAVAADMLLHKDGVDRVRLVVPVADGEDVDEAIKAAGREVKRLIAKGENISHE